MILFYTKYKLKKKKLNSFCCFKLWSDDDVIFFPHFGQQRAHFIFLVSQPLLERATLHNAKWPK